jgi:hypothetical protein
MRRFGPRHPTGHVASIKISMPYNGHPEGSTVIDEATRAFSNLREDIFEKEMMAAEEAGVERARPGTQEFDTLLNSRVPIKWVVTIFNELWVVPEHAENGVEIPHSVASHNEKCFTGGIAVWRQDEVTKAPYITLNNWTGHYRVSEESIRKYGRPAWALAGVCARIGDQDTRRLSDQLPPLTRSLSELRAWIADGCL